MRLHDLQVVISASNAASRYQSVYQHQGQISQIHDMLKFSEDSQHRLGLVNELEEDSETAAIGEKKDNTRKWKKNDTEKDRHRAQEKNYASLLLAEKKARRINPEHIIDIKA
ncbi:MAG: hypothetical protein ACLFP1_02650 [Candidatus Goldiibacteriota bacterium]